MAHGRARGFRARARARRCLADVRSTYARIRRRTDGPPIDAWEARRLSRMPACASERPSLLCRRKGRKSCRASLEEQNQKEWTVGLGAVRRAAICAAHVPTSVHDVIQAFATVSPVGVHVNGSESETLPCGGVFARLSVRPRRTTHRTPTTFGACWLDDATPTAAPAPRRPARPALTQDPGPPGTTYPICGTRRT